MVNAAVLLGLARPIGRMAGQRVAGAAPQELPLAG